MLRYILFFCFFICSECYAGSVVLHEKDAVIWQPEQTITGEVKGISANEVTVYHGGSSFSVPVDQGQFSFQLVLRERENKIWVEVPDGDVRAVSDTLNYTLRYRPSPIITPVADIEGNKAILKANTVANPFNDSLKYEWIPDADNPAQSNIINSRDSVATVIIPEETGDYFYDLLVVSGKDSVWFKTRVTRENNTLAAFDIDSDAPLWMDEAVVYEITPYKFVKDGTFKDITAKLSELKSLGINTIWLQPVTDSFYNGQGYDVIDYLSVDPELGTAQELHRLIDTAKKLDMKVMFDVVLNHTSIEHPYAKDIIKRGTDSPYYNYYQHEKDGNPYSSFYKVNKEGFIVYFWDDLVNLNYNNREVQRWMLEACKYWVREYDIDGYRFDAIWGVNSRMPSFIKRLRSELKSIKPDLLLLAEDKGTQPEVFEYGFDAAYDWTADTTWVSQWSWEYEYNHEKNLTIFNFPKINERGEMLRQALFENRNPHRLLRYMGNNDLPYFIQDHTLEQTKMTAALLFSLPGIPMIYNGQEIGLKGHPYSIGPIFHRDSSIKSLDRKGLFHYYQKLIKLHQQYPSLSVGAEITEVKISPEETMVAFRRSVKNETIIVIINMDSSPATAEVGTGDIHDLSSSTDEYQLRDVLSGGSYKVKGNNDPVRVDMERYSVRLLLLKRE